MNALNIPFWTVIDGEPTSTDHKIRVSKSGPNSGCIFVSAVDGYSFGRWFSTEDLPAQPTSSLPHLRSPLYKIMPGAPDARFAVHVKGVNTTPNSMPAATGASSKAKIDAMAAALDHQRIHFDELVEKIEKVE